MSAPRDPTPQELELLLSSPQLARLGTLRAAARQRLQEMRFEPEVIEAALAVLPKIFMMADLPQYDTAAMVGLEHCILAAQLARERARVTELELQLRPGARYWKTWPPGGRAH